jgi:hypothetical protein
VYFLGRWIDHGGWYPDYQFRFFQRNAVTIDHQEVHGGFIPKGTRAKLRGDLNHFTYPTLYDYLNTMNRFTSLHVSAKLSGRGMKKVRWYNLVLNPISYFVRMFFVHKGYKDGFQGFLLAIYSSIYTLTLYAKTWEYMMSVEKGLPFPPITHQDFQRLKPVNTSTMRHNGSGDSS